MTKTQSIAMLSALIAQHYGPRTVSAFTAADVSIKLTSIANSIVDVEEFHANGYKTERHDAHIAQLSREGRTAECNAYVDRLQRDGAAYVEKRRAALSRKLSRVLSAAGLPESDFKVSGLYGGVRFIGGGREWSIAAR